MGQISAKLRSAQNTDGIRWLVFWCPGCGEAHQITVEGGPHHWSFNGNVERPTFSPSILVDGVEKLTEDEYRRVMKGEVIEPRQKRCHSFVRAGRIEFLGDCTHAFAGQTVDLPDLPPHLQDVHQ